MAANITKETEELLLEKYKKEVQKLRQAAKGLHLTDEDVNNMFEECFRQLNSNCQHESKKKSSFIFILKILFSIIVVFISLFILLNHHQPTISLVLRNVQSLIYPGLKLLRLLAIPVIQFFPSLSELYDESCLIENPYFQVTNMECWPCENVHSVVNFTGAQNFTLYQTVIPHIIRTLNKTVSLRDIQNLYKSHSSIFNQDAQRLKSNSPSLSKANHLLNFVSNNSETHILWRINRMVPARIIRQLFPKPDMISEWSGQSTERFVMIDDTKVPPYILPNPECGNVLLTQGQGERIIILKPAKECSKNCRTTSVTLKESYSLWYNW